MLGRLGSLLGGRALDAASLDELEALLFGADLGVETAEDLLGRVRQEAAGGDAGQVRAVLRKAILEKLVRVEPAGDPLALAAKPHVVLVLGGNGSGKLRTPDKVQVVGTDVVTPHSGSKCLKVEYGQRAGASIAWGVPPQSDVQITWWARVPASPTGGEYNYLRMSLLWC